MAKLTDQFIRSLQVLEGAKEIQVFDEAEPGFGVRKQAGASTSGVPMLGPNMILSLSVPALPDPSGLRRVRCTPMMASDETASMPGVGSPHIAKGAIIVGCGYLSRRGFR